MGTFSNILGKATQLGGDAAQVLSSKGSTMVAAEQAVDAFRAEIKMAALVHEAREQGLWSVATKQADSQSARMAKQSEVWGNI